MNYLTDTITIQTIHGAEDVPGRAFGQWAVHRATFDDEPDELLRWHVTHIPSGKVAFAAPSLVVAARAAKRIQPYPAFDAPHAGHLVALVALCAGLPVWIFRGNWAYCCADIPDIAAWTRAAR